MVNGFVCSVLIVLVSVPLLDIGFGVSPSWEGWDVVGSLVIGRVVAG